MVSPRVQVALAVFGLLALAVVGASVLPDGAVSFELHQVPGLPAAPTAPPIGVPPPQSLPWEITPGAPGQTSHVRVFSPADRSITLVDMTVGPAGGRILWQGREIFSTPTAAPMLVQGDPLRDEVINISLPVQATKDPVWVRLDRSANPACISFSPSLSGTAGRDPVPVRPGDAAPPLPGAETVPRPSGTISVPSVDCAPVAFRGDPANPTELVLYNPATPLNDTRGVLFHYKDNGDGTSTVQHFDPKAQTLGEPQRVPHNAVTITGSPLDASMTIALSPAGQPATVFTIPLQSVRAQLAAGNAADSYLTVAKDALYDTKAYKAVTDEARTYGPAELDGTKWLGVVKGQRVFVDVPQQQLTSAPTLLLETPGAAVQQVAMQRGATANGYVRHVATLPQTWLLTLDEGELVTMRIAYKTTAAKLVTQQLVDDNHGAGWKWKVDGIAPTMGKVEVAPTQANQGHLLVSWSATDAGSGVSAFKVEKRAGTGAWETWIQATKDPSATMSGAPGTAYTFRVTPTDAVGNAGQPGSASHSIPAAQDPREEENRAPTVQLLQPTGGEAFIGVAEVTVQWRAADQDGTVPVINLYVSSDGGATWEPIASPSGTRYTWKVRDLAAGDYRLKVEATDGSLANQDTSGKFRVDATSLGNAGAIGGGNQAGLPGDAAADALDPGPTGEQQTQGPAAAVDPMLVAILALVLIGCAGGVAVWRWRQR